MTNEELAQLYYLRREIEMDTRHLKALERDLKRTRWPDLVRDIRDVIEAKRRRCVAQRDTLEQYISSIQDSYIQQIFTLRYAEGLPWLQVSLRLGGMNTPENLRMIASRYLKRSRGNNDQTTTKPQIREM